MPRPGPRRPLVAIRLSAEGLEFIDQLAEQETEGNRSEMVRRLLLEAVTARQKRRVP
jgi:metal-responsive CopG/Arc/MetJ family transcriptional regulator